MKDSRYIGLVDVPDPKSINARFVYNFFVPDERTNSSGKTSFQGIVTEKTQKLIDTRVLEAQLPRYIELMWPPVTAGIGNIKDFSSQNLLTKQKKFVDSEDNITTDRDAIFRYKDGSLRARIREKAEILSDLLGVKRDDTKGQINELVDSLEFQDSEKGKNMLQEILSPEGAPGVTYVNEVGDPLEFPIFSEASTLNIQTLLERRILTELFSGNSAIEPTPEKNIMIKLAQKDAVQFLPVTSTDADDDSFEPEFRAIRVQRTGHDSDQISTQTIGYIIDRKEINADGTEGDSVKYHIDGEDNTRYLDTKVKYGSTYQYTIRSVALIEMTIAEEGNRDLPPGFYKIWTLLASRPSKSTTKLCEERRPPAEPDGVFFRFNYTEGIGLVIRWQIPVGKQRDTKYFQVFRRSSIYDPYTCIAEIDFDNSLVKSPRTEKINSDRIIKTGSPMIQFIDAGFTRETKQMYAVAAVDAHGLTSGYSAQTLVSFDKINNVINLKSISRAGAPKQYPNFFIDPDLDDNIFVDSLTQDAMTSSKKQTARVYFTPDAVNITSRDGRLESLLATKNEGGLYKIHLLNIDRQKSVTLEVNIDDLR